MQLIFLHMALQDIDVWVNWLYLVTRILQQIFLDVRVLEQALACLTQRELAEILETWDRLIDEPM